MKKVINYFMLVLFVIGLFLLSLNSFSKAQASEVYPFNGIINADSLAIYKSNDTSVAAVTELAYGTSVKVLADASTSSKNLYKIEYDNGTIGYTWKKYVINVDANVLSEDSIVNGIESYRTYCDSLIKGGFEESYCPYLYYLHSKHPNWVFAADKINATLAEVAKEESSRSVLATNNKNYWVSDSTHEGSYYYVNETVTASFLDPRNSLFEETIFQFLDFEQSKDFVNDKAMKTMISSGNLTSYYNDFKVAGSNNGVNPLHLLARSKQEGANNKSYLSVSGTFTTTNSKNTDYQYNTMARGNSLDGYYNFYNIGAWYGSGYSAIGRGLAYAGGFLENDKCYNTVDGVDTYDVSKCGVLSYLRPWNTQAQAIAGGANFISETYVKMGQNTNYFEKFNVSSKSKYEMYAHQYMTNIHAPASEANSLWNAYKDSGLVDSNFVFQIPVYKEMPEDNYQPVDKDTNSRLSSITIDDKLLSGFDPERVEYNNNYITDKETIKIGAKTESSLSKVTGTGNHTFVNGVVNVNLVVTAEDGSTSTYTLVIKQVLPEQSVTVNDVVAKMGVKIDGTIMYGVSPDTAVSTLINTVTKNKGTANVTNASGKAKTSGVFVTGDKITINGTTESKTYTISVRGDINLDGKVTILDLLLVQKHILGKTELKNELYYAAELNNDNKISILDLLLVQKHILDKGKL